MKTKLFHLLLVPVLQAMTLIAWSADPIFKPGDILTICGDSITQQGLYSVNIEDYLLMCQTAQNVKVIQCGWGGTSAPHFAANMKNTALTYSPTIATTCYGMNDGGYNVMSEAIAKQYGDGLTKVIQQFKASGVRTIVVASPGGVDSFYFKNPKHKEVTAEMYNETLGKLGDIAKSVAQAEGVLFADLHSPVMEAMGKAKATLGDKYGVMGDVDGVHCAPNGHLIMAYAFLKAMGFDGKIGTITYDAQNRTATATDGHRVLAVKDDEICLESTRYPFCFVHGNDYSSGHEDSILPFLPFNQDLNRYILVVNNLKTPKAKVVWGSESREFSAADLKKGINLAAEFLKNPFVPSFTAVNEAVVRKCKYNQMVNMTYLGENSQNWRKQFPDQSAAFDAIEANFRIVNNAMLEKCAQLVKPVVHAIKIEPIP